MVAFATNVSVQISSHSYDNRKKRIFESALAKRWNGKVKIITGVRRCGKSFLLSTIYKKHLLEEGVQEDDFIEIALDRKSDIKFRNPNLLYEYIIQYSKESGIKSVIRTKHKRK